MQGTLFEDMARVSGSRQGRLTFGGYTTSSVRGTPAADWITRALASCAVRVGPEDMPTMTDLQAGWDRRQQPLTFAIEWQAVTALRRIGSDAERQTAEMLARREGPRRPQERPLALDGPAVRLALEGPKGCPVERLRGQGVSIRAIARRLGMPATTVRRKLGLVP